jgi:hypothetical protein
LIIHTDKEPTMFVGMIPDAEELARLFQVVVDGIDETPIPLPSSTDVLELAPR